MASTRICVIEGCGKRHKAFGWCQSHLRRWVSHSNPLGGRSRNGEAMRYFLEVVLKYEGDDCLAWPFGRMKNGYGRMYENGKMNVVSRLVCREIKGPPPTPWHHAAHSCGKGHEGCCSPKHLRWATPAENHADKIEHGTTNRGTKACGAKLTEADVIAIHAMKGTMPSRLIGEIFSVKGRTVDNIFGGRTWAWLTPTL